MNNIEKYLDQACKSINGTEELRQHLRQELKEHLEEAIEALVAEGASRDEATRQAMEGLGEPETIRDGMESVYGPGVTSLFVDKAIKWRDRKWHIAAQAGLGLIVSSAIGCTIFMLIMIVPKLHQIHEDMGRDVPAILGTTMSCAICFGENIWICLALMLGGWGLFEWKCRSENKAHLRTVIGVVLALLSVLAAFWFMFVIAVWFSLLASAGVPIN